MPKLGVNIDHIATLRQLRKSTFPDILCAAKVCEAAGADSLVVHLREDRRHIQDKDVVILRKKVSIRLNLEMSIAPSIVNIACSVKPDQATLVPEKRKELTTEGGLDVVRWSVAVARVIRRLEENKIETSLFIEPDKKQIRAAADCGARIIELHTGRYANSQTATARRGNFKKINEAVQYAKKFNMLVNAGHGLDYENVKPIASLEGLYELNIGYAIICHSIFYGLKASVLEMKKLIS
jgi:pyridoxine 5-phosphate synthase